MACIPEQTSMKTTKQQRQRKTNTTNKHKVIHNHNHKRKKDENDEQNIYKNRITTKVKSFNKN